MRGIAVSKRLERFEVLEWFEHISII